MDKTQKDSYRKVSEDPVINDTVDAELGALNFGTHARNNILHPRTIVLDNPRCFKQSKAAAERLIDETLAKVSRYVSLS